MTWHMVGPRADKVLIGFLIPMLVFVYGYNIANGVMLRFAYSATKEYPAMDLAFLNNPCGDTKHWFGFKATHGDGKGHRVHALVCLTPDGWAVIPRDNG